MAVELLAFSASTQIHEEGYGEIMELVGIHEYVEAGIQYQSSFESGSDFIQSGEDFQSEIDRILKTILLKISPFSQIPVQPSVSCTSPVNPSEFVPVLKCPDGGHRCPYFPCPTCHRDRSISGPKSSHSGRSQSCSNSKSDIHHALIKKCDEDEVICQENDPSAISNAYIDMHPLSRVINDDQSEFFVPVLESGDGGHRCPYFPCPTCHRSRSIVAGTESNSCYNVMTCEFEDQISDPVLFPALITYPDGGHKCPYFPCPTCHRSR